MSAIQSAASYDSQPVQAAVPTTNQTAVPAANQIAVPAVNQTAVPAANQAAVPAASIIVSGVRVPCHYDAHGQAVVTSGGRPIVVVRGVPVPAVQTAPVLGTGVVSATEAVAQRLQV